ncbi:MAG: hypothetical protein ACFE7E_08240, partial [Candidatus Hodarchaeota archaeon]
NYEIPKEQRVKLCMEQEKIRLSIPREFRETLHFDEWIYYYADFFKKPVRGKSRGLLADFAYWLFSSPGTFEDVLIITSERLVRHKSVGKEEERWVIPIEKIETVLASGIFDYEKSYAQRFLAGRRRDDYLFLYAYFLIGYQTNRGLRHKEVRIRRHGDERVSPEVNVRAVEEYIERARDVRRIRLGY